MEVHSFMLTWRTEVYDKYLPLYSPLTFCESASHRTWNLPFYWPMRPQDLLVSQTLVLELNSYVMPSLYLRAGDPNSGPRVCNVKALYTLINLPSFAK